ncbi:MAG: hypothetical protein IJ745_06590, partial [Bacteroidales bacterium]|nr:hypothetical protein [Bacteroidales bacterium]
MKKRLFLIAFAAAAFGTQVRAQFDETNNLFYHTLRTPQSTLYNPAFFPTNNTIYFMLPGFDLQFGSPLAMNDIIRYDKTTETTVVDLSHMLQSLNENNQFRLGANVNILGFGMKIKSIYFNVHTRLVNNVSLGLPISTVNALVEGNVDSDGETKSVVDIVNGDILNATSYLETGVGAAYEIEPLHLTVGLRAKLLYGIANVQTDNTKVVVNTDPNLDSVSASIYYDVQSATFAPYDTSQHSFIVKFGDLLNLGKANTGLAFDLGAKYEMGPFTFSVALNDLSAGIHWKNNVTSWSPESGPGVITFSGLDVNSMLENGSFSTDSIATLLREKLNGMTPTRIDTGDYWYSIPTKINIGASYSFAKIFRAGLLLHGQFDRGLLCKSLENKLGIDVDNSNTFRFNTTLTFGANLFNWAE